MSGFHRTDRGNFFIFLPRMSIFCIVYGAAVLPLSGPLMCDINEILVSCVCCPGCIGEDAKPIDTRFFY
jgi:hypothetical protein